MRRTIIALIAVASLSLAGLTLIAHGPGSATYGLSAASSTTDILGLTRAARDLPEQSYPAH